MGKGEVYIYKNDTELSQSILVVAKYTYEDVEFTSKRLCGFYPETTQKDVLANTGLMLIYQRMIREARKVKEGHKKVSSGRKEVDLSAVEAV